MAQPTNNFPDPSELTAVTAPLLHPEAAAPAPSALAAAPATPAAPSNAEELIEQGRVEGMRASIVRVLETRSRPPSDSGREKLTSCYDRATLTLWLTRAVTARSEAEVFGAGKDAKAKGDAN